MNNTCGQCGGTYVEGETGVNQLCDDCAPRYKIVRHFFQYKGGCSRTIKTGLLLREAQEHCRNKETSSKTATSAKMVKYTEEHGPWFDGYDKE